MQADIARNVVIQGAVFSIIGVALSIAVLYSGTRQNSGWLFLFVALYMSICVVAWFVYSGNGHFDLLSPIPVFLLILLLYAASSGIVVDASGATYAGDEVSPYTRVVFYSSCLVGAIGFVLGGIAGKNAYIVRPRNSPDSWRGNDIAFVQICLVAGLILSVVSFTDVIARFNFLEVASYQEWAFSSRVDRQADLSAGIREVLFVYLPVNLLLAGCIALACGGRLVGVRVMAIAVVLAYLATNTLAGARAVVVEAAIPAIIYWHYRVRRIKAVELGFGLVLGYAFINLLSIARLSSDPMRMFEIVLNAVQDSGAEVVGLGAVSELWTATNLHRLIQGLSSGETGYTYGQSFISEVLTFVPRAVMPDRPMSLAESFVDVFYPGLLESGGGMGFFVLQEGYWAFGLAGVFVSMCVYGFLLERIYRTYLRYQSSVAATLLYGFAYAPLVLSSVRSGLIGSCKSALLMMFPLALAAVGARLLGRRHDATKKSVVTGRHE